MKKSKLLLFASLLSFPFLGYSQEEPTEESSEEPTEEVVEEESPFAEATYEGTRIINGHSIENLRKGVLEFRVEHRFGDIAGSFGGAQTLFGLDNSADIRIAFEYGVTDNFMIGLGRCKGNGNPYNALIDGFGKYKILRQEKDKMPFTLSALGTMSYTYKKASEDIALVQHYPKQAHRMAYSAQLNIARKFGERFSASLMPTFVHRNYVLNSDQNSIFAMGGAFRLGVTSKVSLLVEYYHCLNEESGLRLNNKNSLGFAVEWITFGHNFTIYLTNSSGFGETQFITNTTEDWLKGQFRLGFCIGRKFERGSH
ncbi:MAG: DUF5777 family beta-barrel protein [Fluviicola sp.]|jgi:hypothetical protein